MLKDRENISSLSEDRANSFVFVTNTNLVVKKTEIRVELTLNRASSERCSIVARREWSSRDREWFWVIATSSRGWAAV